MQPFAVTCSLASSPPTPPSLDLSFGKLTSGTGTAATGPSSSSGPSLGHLAQFALPPDIGGKGSGTMSEVFTSATRPALHAIHSSDLEGEHAVGLGSAYTVDSTGGKKKKKSLFGKISKGFKNLAEGFRKKGGVVSVVPCTAGISGTLLRGGVYFVLCSS